MCLHESALVVIGELNGGFTFPPQPHYVPDNYKRNGGRSSWKSERPKMGCKDELGGAGCEEGCSPAGPRLCDGPGASQLDSEEGGAEGDATDVLPGEPPPLPPRPTALPATPQDRGAEEEEEEEDEDEDEEEEEEEEEGEDEDGAEGPEIPPSSSCSSSHHSGLGRREAQRERLNKILLNLLHQTPGKNGETSRGSWRGAGLGGALGRSTSGLPNRPARTLRPAGGAGEGRG